MNTFSNEDIELAISDLQSVSVEAGTSLLTIAIPPGAGAIINAARLLNRESSVACNIKRALRCAQHQLKLLGPVGHPNGCLIFCGADVSRTVFPPRAVPHPLYLCDRRFHIDMLEDMVAQSTRFGFVVCDGQSAVVATVVGRQRIVHAAIDSMAKGRTRRGGQSSHRFERLRDEAEHEYVKKICDAMRSAFIRASEAEDPAPTVEGIVLAGCAGVKHLVLDCCRAVDMLGALVFCVLDVQHTGNQGITEALALSVHARAAREHSPSAALLRSFHVAAEADTGLCVYGINETVAALQAGAVRVLLVDQIAAAAMPNPEAGEAASLLEWAHEGAGRHGAALCLVGANTVDGVRFRNGYGGIGGLLRWRFQHQDDLVVDEQMRGQEGEPPGAAEHDDRGQSPSITPPSTNDTGSEEHEPHSAKGHNDPSPNDPSPTPADCFVAAAAAVVRSLPAPSPSPSNTVDSWEDLDDRNLGVPCQAAGVHASASASAGAPQPTGAPILAAAASGPGSRPFCFNADALAFVPRFSIVRD